MRGTTVLAAAAWLCLSQGAPLDGTWELTRIIRSGVAQTTTSFVPDADSLELKRVKPDAPYPAVVQDVVTRP